MSLMTGVKISAMASMYDKGKCSTFENKKNKQPHFILLCEKSKECTFLMIVLSGGTSLRPSE